MNAMENSADIRPKITFMSIIGNFRLLLVLAMIITVFTILNPAYLSVNSIYSILMSITILGFACIGQTFCIFVGGFDLSVGSTVLVSGCTAAFLIRNFGINVWAALFIILIEGIIIGAINGLIITKGKINPLITTLAMSFILNGLVFLLTEGSFINVREQEFRILGLYRFFNQKFLQLPIIIIVIMFIIFFILLKFTYFGKYIYAVGGNKVAAKFSGINTNLIEASAYIIAGFTAALGGFIFASRVGAAQPTIGGNFALISIAAVILGGVSLSGGKGSILGAFIGLLILQSLNMGLMGMGLATYFQDIASGTVLLMAVFFDVFKKK